LTFAVDRFGALIPNPCSTDSGNRPSPTPTPAALIALVGFLLSIAPAIEAYTSSDVEAASV